MNDLFALGMALILFIGVFCLAAYLVNAFAYRRVLLYFKHESPWMAFVPILNSIAIVQCMNADASGNVHIFGKPIQKKMFIWYPVIALVIAWIPAVGAFLSTAALIICNGFTFKDLLSRSNMQKSDVDVLAWISAVFGIVWVVLCFLKFKGTAPVEVVENAIEE